MPTRALGPNLQSPGDTWHVIRARAPLSPGDQASDAGGPEAGAGCHSPCHYNNSADIWQHRYTFCNQIKRIKWWTQAMRSLSRAQPLISQIMSHHTSEPLIRRYYVLWNKRVTPTCLITLEISNSNSTLVILTEKLIGGEYFSRPLLNFLIFLISDIDNLRWITNLSIRIQDEAMNHSNLILLH